MSTHDPIANAKRRAKELSRAGTMTHQKALDAIARQEGHAHWAAFASSCGRLPIPTVDEPPATASRPGWRTMQLERMTGARHSPMDEWVIRSFGRPLGRLCLTMGRMASSVMIIAACTLCACLQQSISGSAEAFFTMLVLLCSPYLVAMGITKPDHSSTRTLRRSILSFAVFWMVLTIGSCVALSIGQHPAGMHPSDGILKVLCILPTVLMLSIILSSATWTGREMRRRR